MALGAIIFSFPTAVLGSAYMVAMHDLGVGHAVASYACLGFLSMALVTVMVGLNADFD